MKLTDAQQMQLDSLVQEVAQRKCGCIDAERLKVARSYISTVLHETYEASWICDISTHKNTEALDAAFTAPRPHDIKELILSAINEIIAPKELPSLIT